MKKDEKNLVILIGIILVLFMIKNPQQTYDIFGIGSAGDILTDVVSKECDSYCPTDYEICVTRLGPDSSQTIKTGLTKVVSGGNTGGILYSDDARRCLKVGYVKGSYVIMYNTTFTKGNYYSKSCESGMPTAEFCLYTDNAYTGYDRYRYAMLPNSGEYASGIMDGMDILISPAPAKIRVGYLCDQNPCDPAGRENRWLEWLSRQNYVVMARYYSSWTLNELMDQNVLICRSQTSCTVLPGVVTAHSSNKVGLVEWAGRRPYGISFNHFTNKDLHGSAGGNVRYACVEDPTNPIFYGMNVVFNTTLDLFTPGYTGGLSYYVEPSELGDGMGIMGISTRCDIADNYVMVTHSGGGSSGKYVWMTLPSTEEDIGVGLISSDGFKLIDNSIYWVASDTWKPPAPPSVDVWAIFNSLFAMIWDTLKVLFGWLTV